MKHLKITQKQVDLWTLWFMESVCILLALQLFFFSTHYNVSYAFGTIIGIVAISISLLLYKKGFYKIARVFCTILLCLLVIVTTSEPFLTQTFTTLLYIIPLLAMLLLGRTGFLSSWLLIYLGLLIRSDFKGAYVDPIGIILSTLYLGFVTILSIRFDTERLNAEENEHIAHKAVLESEQQRKVLDKQATQMMEEEAKLKASIANFPRGYILTDLGGKIIITNKLTQTIFNLGHKPDTLTDIQQQLGSSLDIISIHSSMIATREAVTIKEVGYGTKYLRVLLSPIYITHGEIIGGVILVEDITEEKALQRSRDEFFSIASHELRTPLTAIRGNTSMIKDYYGDKIEDSELKQMIDDIHDSSVRLIMIVNDFLTTSRLEQGKMIFNKTLVHVEELIDSSVKEVQHLIQEKKLYLHVELGDTRAIPPVVTDKDRIKEVLVNLLGNAIKFTEKGGITVTCKVDQHYIKVSVRDTGSGIPLQNQGLLFRKFQQASNNILIRDTTRSTGLGLYISKLIVENLGGKIFLESSEETKGSVFSFTIPKVLNNASPNKPSNFVNENNISIIAHD